VSYTDADGTTFGGGEVETTLIQGTLYAKAGLGRGYVDGQVSFGQLQFDSSRPGNIPGVPATLNLDDGAMAYSGEIGAGAFLGERVKIGPRVSLRYSVINFDDVAESGGLAALAIDREEYRSLQGRAGILLNGSGGGLLPHFAATYVHDFEEQPEAFGANFVGGTGAPVLFGLTSDDSDWLELTGGLTYNVGRVELSVSVDSTLGRDSVENQSYRAGLKIRF
jgi:outer membrane autotransporter protein